jgi:regulator of RNase E activity RraB
MSKQDTYSLFPGERDGKPTWTTINVSWADAPDPKLKTWIHVRMPVPKVTAEGLPKDEIREALDAAEDAVIDQITQGLSGRHVGSISHDGFRHVYFYAPSDRRLADLLRPLAAELGAMAPSAMSRADNKQELYDEILGPDAWQFEFLRNARVLGEMSLKGDDLSGSREIEHFALFSQRTNADSFAAQAEEQGYLVDDPQEQTHQGRQIFVVRLVKSTELDVYLLTDATLALSQMAEDCEGEFDGWSAEARGSG